MGLPSLETSRHAQLMGGTVSIYLRSASSGPHDAARAAEDADRLLRRIGRWADRLTRFSTASDLSALNGATSAAVAVSPTLAAALDWGRSAESLTGGLVDIALLDERLAAEGLTPKGSAPQPGAWRAWRIARGRRSSIVHRPDRLRFDLDGVAKGWMADRALELLARYEDRVVDADGDIAVAVGPEREWSIGVADPRNHGHDLVVLRLASSGPRARFGVATSGTSIHRWQVAGEQRHHLIDPRTRRPAVTDVVQATVLADSARVAEALAKLVVILGSQRGMAAAQAAGAHGLVLLTDRDELLLSPGTMRWLA